MYSTLGRKQTMLLCKVRHEIRMFQGGVWNTAVVKFHILCNSIHRHCMAVDKCRSVYQTTRLQLVFKSFYVF